MSPKKIDKYHYIVRLKEKMWVTSDPLDSLSFPLDQATMIRATSSRGVQVDLGKEELT